MKFRILTSITAMALFAALAIPVRHTAQGQPAVQGGSAEHTRYKFVDLGTFGGPNSGLNCCGIIPPVLSNQGVVVDTADTSVPNPNAGNPNPLLCCEAFVNPAFKWRDGVLTNLGTLTGGYNSFANSVNARGDVVGTSENGETDPQGFPQSHPVLWKQGVAIDLGTFGGYNGLAFAINNHDEVVGAAESNIPDPFSYIGFYFAFVNQSRAFLWKNGALQDLGTLGGNDASASFVNERGQVARVSYTDSTPKPNSGLVCPTNVPTQHPFFWENGKMQDLGTLGGFCAAPAAINNRGQVAGNSDLAEDTAFPHAFLWSRETGMKDLGTLGGTFAQADDLTDAGEVVGASTIPNDQAFHAFLWRKDVFTDLGTLPDDCFSSGFAINSRGQIVGDSLPCDFSTTHPFLWETGQIISLQAFVPPASGFTLGEPSFIDDRGDIAGYGFLNNGDTHAFLLVSCGADDTSCQETAAGPWTESGRPVPSAQPPTETNQGNPLRQILQHRLGVRRLIGTPLRGGTAISGPKPNATLSPTSLLFRCRNVTNAGCQCITYRTTTLSNLGNAPLSIKGITVTGAFSETNNCGTSLGAGNSCTIFVRWLLNNSSGSVYVSDNAPGSPQQVSLSGFKECTPL